MGNPEVYQNKVIRVCVKVTNWGVGTRKTFVFRVVYASTQQESNHCKSAFSAATTIGGVVAEAAIDAVCETVVALFYGEGSANISNTPGLSRDKLTIARAGSVGKSKILEPGISGEIDANDQLPKGSQKAGTRYQVSTLGSGWVDCDSGTGGCPIPTAMWTQRSPGVGTLKNTGQAPPLNCRVILDYTEVNSLDRTQMYEIK